MESPGPYMELKEEEKPTITYARLSTGLLTHCDLNQFMVQYRSNGSQAEMQPGTTPHHTHHIQSMVRLLF